MLSQFFKGIQAPYLGFLFLRKNKRLVPLIILPTFLNILVTGGLLYFFVKVGFGYLTDYWDNFPEGYWWGFVKILLGAGALISSLIFGFCLWFVLEAIFCSYFFSKLAREVLLTLSVAKDQLREVSLWYEFVDALRAVSFLALVQCTLLVLAFVPFVGSVLAPILSGYFLCFILGYDFFDYSLQLKGMRRSEKLVYLKSHRFQTLGAGLAAFLLAFIPVLGPILLSALVVGTTLLSASRRPESNR